MKLERKHAWILVAIAVWNVLTYARFTKALMDDDDPTHHADFFIAHSFLIVVNVLIAILLATWGVRVLRSRPKAPR